MSSSFVGLSKTETDKQHSGFLQVCHLSDHTLDIFSCYVLLPSLSALCTTLPPVKSSTCPVYWVPGCNITFQYSEKWMHFIISFSETLSLTKLQTWKIKNQILCKYRVVHTSKRLQSVWGCGWCTEGPKQLPVSHFMVKVLCSQRGHAVQHRKGQKTRLVEK